MINKIKLFIRILCYLFFLLIIGLMIYAIIVNCLQEFLLTILFIIVVSLIGWAFNR